ncbi:MAG: sigma-70 family RNA polymerase sigma factor [Gemmataceae bacterium]
MSTRVPSRPRRAVMAAVVLGTALSTLGPARVHAADPTNQAAQELGRYCTTCWRNARLPVDAWGDSTQEVLCRMLERVPTTRWSLALKGEGEERREFIRAIDAVKKRVQRTRQHSDAVEAVADPRGSGDGRRAEERALVRQAAEELLTPRQQRILVMSFEGWTIPEIGAELALPVERVSDEKYKAIRKLRAHLAEREG